MKLDFIHTLTNMDSPDILIERMPLPSIFNLALDVCTWVHNPIIITHHIKYVPTRGRSICGRYLTATPISPGPSCRVSFFMWYTRFLWAYRRYFHLLRNSFPVETSSFLDLFTKISTGNFSSNSFALLDFLWGIFFGTCFLKDFKIFLIKFDIK